MAVAENGALVNGSASKHGLQPTRSTNRERARKPSKGLSAWLFSTFARLSIWYLLITCLFRCPLSSNHLTDSSPQVCRPYLTTISYLRPHLEPYYQSYAAPYVEIARPYAQQLDQKVINPATQIAKHNYQTYAAPRIEHAQAFGNQEWEKTVLPQMDIAQKKAHELYGASIAPHVEKLSSMAEPYYGLVKDNALKVYEKHIMPASETTKPYLQEVYGITQAFLLDTGMPYAQWAWSSLVIFVDGTFWPQMRALYGDNVKPQLVMISERIAKYQEGRKLRATMDKVESSILVSSEMTSQSTVTATPEIIQDTPTPSEESAPAPTELTGDEQIAAAREQIATDLHIWQEKFAKAADKGSENLQERVRELVMGLVKSEVDGEGQGLLTALNKTVENETASFKFKIIKIVSTLPADILNSDHDIAEKEIQDDIRQRANSIRERAFAIRQWHSKFETAITKRAEAAAESTLDVLDSIRDLGLQEIGMRWAWMDGVTYKDWAKYHELKKQFENWRNEVREVATKHEIIGEAKKPAYAILEDAMDIAKDAAMELVRLKDVGKWKIHAHDATDNFESRAMPAAAVSAASKVADNVNIASESIVASGKSTMDSIVSKAGEAVGEAVGEAASTASSAVLESSQGRMESIASQATRVAAEAANSASSVVVGTSQGVAESIASEATRSVATMASEMSVGIVGESSSGVIADLAASAQSVTSQVADSANGAAHTIGSVPSQVKEVISPSTVGDVTSFASSIAASASSKVFGGAMAQEVSGSTPIFDDVIDESDEATFSEKLQSVVNDAGDKYADVTRAAREAFLGTDKGALESATSIASAEYANALAAASSVLYGTTQGTVESVTSLASERYSQAVSAASAAIYGTPLPTTQSLLSQANAAYSDAINQAHSQYEQAKSIVSVQISGTPKPIHEEMFSSVESAYSGSLAAASGKLDSAMSAASQQYTSLTNAAGSVVSRPTQGPLESISSVASSNLQIALSMASAQYSNAKEAVGATPTPAHQQYLLDAQQKYYAAMGMAHERYSDFMTAASAAVVGTPTPLLSSMSHAASQAVYGTSAPAYQSVIDAASLQYAAASSAAAANLEVLLSSAKSAVGVTTGSPVQSMFDQASSQYDSALSAASSSLSAASVAASAAAYGTSTGAMESAASQASENWEALVSKASEQIYGAPTPVFASLTSQAGDYSSQVTDAAAVQYANLQAFVSELVSGKEPDFTDSVMIRLSAAYYTGYHASLASSASSLAGEAYLSVSSVASSVSSVASSAASTYFTPPPQIESILGTAADQLNAMVDAANAQVYGTTKGIYEQATSAAGDAYSSASSIASENIYGTQTGYAEAAQSSMSSAISSAQEALTNAIYGTPTGTIESATSLAGDTYSSVSSAVASNVAAAGSVANDAYSSVAAKVSEAIYGPEQSALESAQSRLAAAVESAQARLSDFAASASHGASGAVDAAKSNVENLASSVSSIASSVTSRGKDEL